MMVGDSQDGDEKKVYFEKMDGNISERAYLLGRISSFFIL